MRFFNGCKLSGVELETKEIIAIILEFRCTIQLVIEADGSDNQCQNVECPIIDNAGPMPAGLQTVRMCIIITFVCLPS